MNESPHQTHEQRKEQLLIQILEGQLLVDASIESYLIPIHNEEVEMLIELEVDVSHIRLALPEEVPRILQLLDWTRLINEAIAE